MKLAKSKAVLDNFACFSCCDMDFFGGGNMLLLSDSKIGRRKMTDTVRFALQGEVMWRHGVKGP